MKKMFSLLTAYMLLIVGAANAKSTLDIVKDNLKNDSEAASDGDKCIGTSGTHG